MDNNNPTFTIIGAGLSGSLMAVYLAKAGYKVDVYEQRGDLRTADVGPGRSINLALSVRGIHALERAGLAKRILADAVPMPGRMIHHEDGRQDYQPYSKNPDEFINSVSRLGLNRTMIEIADESPSVSMHFNHKCIGVDLDSGQAHLQNTETNETIHTDGDILIGADGAFSAVRATMQRTDRFNYRQFYLQHGYKELNIPPGPNGQHRLDKNALHIWPRRSYMMIALPNQDGSFTCTLFWPLDGPRSFDALQTPDQIQAYFTKHFADALPHMPTLVHDYQTNPTSSLVTVRCEPWHVDGSIVLIGDAAHAVVPFYGQGINCGFEDCEALLDCIDQHAPDWPRALSEYTSMRKENADAISQLAIDNFLEMRDHVGSPKFLRKKKFERLKHNVFPNYLPLYSMVSFSRIPYAQAVQRAKQQDRTVRNTLVAAAINAIAIVILALWWWT
jgi:kynurenine 3-monooxygenase